MNPNFLNNITPEQILQFQTMITPEMMKGMTNQISTMNDDQLKNYLLSMGMGHISPQMFRSMSQNMSNLTDNDFNKIKSMTPSQIQNLNNQESIHISEPKNIVEKLEYIKRQGNELFKQNQFKEACNKYYEVINEITLSSENIRIEYIEQFRELERIARLNIANCKLILNEYDSVINECLKVLENYKCFKAYYRLGVALLKKQKIEKAIEYLGKAKQIGNSDEKQAIEPYITESLRLLHKNQKKEEGQELKSDEKTNEFNKPLNNFLKTDSQLNPKLTKLNQMKEILEKEKTKNKEYNEDNENEIKIETLEKPNNTISSLNCKNNDLQNNAVIPNQEQVKEKLNAMTDTEINTMVETMKSMDNETICSMLKSQGMSLSSQDIAFVKNAMTPETLKMIKNSDLQMPKIPNNQVSATSSSLLSQQNPEIQPLPNLSNSIPNFGNMDYKSMLNFIKKNPKMMKMISPQLSQMMGGKEPNPELMINAMEKILFLLSIPSKIKRFCKSKRGICIIILITVLIYLFFRKK